MESIFSLLSYQSVLLSSQDMRCVGEVLGGTWGHVVFSLSCKVFSAGEKDIIPLPKLVDSAPLAGGCGVVLQTWLSRAALCCVVGRLLHVNSCFLSRWSGNCCTVWEGPGNGPFRQMNTTSGFLFISLCSYSLSTSLPSPSFKWDLSSCLQSDRNKRDVCLPCSPFHTHSLCSRMFPCSSGPARSRADTAPLPILCSRFVGAAGKNRSSAAVSDHQPWLCVSYSH